MSPLNTDTQENVRMKFKALQQEVDDLKTDLTKNQSLGLISSERVLMFAAGGKKRTSTRNTTSRELQEEKYFKWKKMNWVKEVRWPKDKTHMKFTMKIPVNERRDRPFQ